MTKQTLLELKPTEEILKLKNPLEIFDITCANNYFAGTFNENMPVDDSRKAYERIKKLLRRSEK